jgi:hypothetical protein
MKQYFAPSALILACALLLGLVGCQPGLVQPLIPTQASPLHTPIPPATTTWTAPTPIVLQAGKLITPPTWTPFPTLTPRPTPTRRPGPTATAIPLPQPSQDSAGVLFYILRTAHGIGLGGADTIANLQGLQIGSTGLVTVAGTEMTRVSWMQIYPSPDNRRVALLQLGDRRNRTRARIWQWLLPGMAS